MKTSRNQAIYIAGIFLALITFLVYLPSLQNGFVGWDDPDYVYENTVIRSLDLNFLKLILTSPLVYNWHPLTMLSYAVDYLLWGLNPMGYHLVNIVLHSIDTFLVFILFVRLIGIAEKEKKADGLNINRLAAAFLAAAFFGLHPLHVESVAWISERKDVLCAFFFLLSVLMYLKYAEAKPSGKLYYGYSLFLFILALMSKPMAVTLPAVLLILDFHPLNRSFNSRVLFEKAPFLLLSVLSSVLTIWAQQKGGALIQIDAYPAAWRAVVAVRAYIFYIYKMILPLDLAPFYPLPFKTELLSFGSLACFALFLGVSVFCVFMIPRTRIFLAVWLYYIITVLPVAGIIQVGQQAAADRYMYLPSLGFFILAGAGVKYLLERFNKKLYIACMYVSAVLVLSTLAAMTIKQEAVWKDSMTLWSYEIKKIPLRVSIAYYNRGALYKDLGYLKQALDDYDVAVSINPGFKDPYINRGIVYSELKRYEEAINDFNKAIELDPKDVNTYIAYYNRGVLYKDLGYLKQALDDYDVAVSLNPGFKDLYINRGIVYSELKRYGEAINDFNKAIELDPKGASTYINRGNAYLKAGDINAGIEDLNMATRLDPQNAAAYYNLGFAYSKVGDIEKARFCFKEAYSLGLKEALFQLKLLGLNDP